MAPNPPFVDNEKPSTAKWNTLVGRYDVATSEIDVVSTASETALYSKSISAGDLSSDRMLRLTIRGDILNNTGASHSFTLKVKFGGTTIYDSTGSGWVLATAAGRRPFKLLVELANLNATNIQFMGGEMLVGNATGATTGIGRLGDDVGSASGSQSSTQGLIHMFSSNGTHAVDTTAACTLEVTVTPSLNSASLSVRRKHGILELL